MFCHQRTVGTVLFVLELNKELKEIWQGIILLFCQEQTNRVLLNMLTDYNARLLASDIKTYFETNQDALEVLIFKGKKSITIKRGLACNPGFNRIFRKIYEK